jgi:hypothetical protein
MFQNRTRKLAHDFGATTLASVGLLAIITVFAVLFVMAGTSTVTAATFNFQGGIQDNYVLPTEPTTPNAGVQIYMGGGPFAPYDYNSPNRRFLETFENCPTCIEGANLTIGMKSLDSLASNDTIRFLFSDNSGNAVGPHWISQIGDPTADNSVLPNTWGTTNYPSGVIKTFNLQSLQLGALNTSGSTSDLRSAIGQFGFLDVDLQDDTSVDFINLQIKTALAGDMNGDGTVDIADYNLLVTNFNQPTPNGVGDPNGDGVLNIQDLSIVQADFGKSCPEPSTIGLITMGVCWFGGVLQRRRDPQIGKETEKETGSERFAA